MCPFDDEETVGDDETCAICGDDATQTAYFAKNY
jgi:hypothetical protein